MTFFPSFATVPAILRPEKARLCANKLRWLALKRRLPKNRSGSRDRPAPVSIRAWRRLSTLKSLSRFSSWSARRRQALLDLRWPVVLTNQIQAHPIQMAYEPAALAVSRIQRRPRMVVHPRPFSWCGEVKKSSFFPVGPASSRTSSP